MIRVGTAREASVTQASSLSLIVLTGGLARASPALPLVPSRCDPGASGQRGRILSKKYIGNTCPGAGLKFTFSVSKTTPIEA